MAERITPQERPISPERSREELYADTLKLKRDVLSSHYAMNSLRREINERIDEISDEEFGKDPEVAKYGKVSKEYNKRRKLFLESLDGLSEEDKEKLNGLTSLTKVEVELSATGGLEEEKAEGLKQNVFEKEERDYTLGEVDNMLEYSRRTGKVLELAYWEAKKKELEEREEAEANPDRTPPKGFLARVKDVYNRRREESTPKMFPLGLKEYPQPEQAPEEAEQKEPEPKKPSTWGWLKERSKGVWNFGIWEFHQAERFRSKTKEVADEAKILATLIEEERDMTPEAAEKEAWAIVDALKSKDLDISAPEFYQVSSEFSENKRKENDDEIEYIIRTAGNELLDKLQKYRGEAGQDVLTEENKLAFQNDLRAELNKSRDGFLKQYTVDLAEVMRRNLDENWWRRYIWGATEAVLGFAGVKFITMQIEKAALAKLLAAEKAAAGSTGAGAGAAEQIVTQAMNENVWNTLKEMAQNGPQHFTPTNEQLVEWGKTVVDTNHWYEPEWVKNIVDGLRSTRTLPQGMPMQIPAEVMTALGY